jgi:hypothetical protein
MKPQTSPAAEKIPCTATITPINRIATPIYRLHIAVTNAARPASFWSARVGCSATALCSRRSAHRCNSLTRTNLAG